MFVTLHAQNPIIQTIYTADPAPMVYKDTLFLYTGHDEDSSTWFTMKDWHVYSTTDMVNWTDRGCPLSLKTFSWAVKDAWASQCIYRNGKFYWYVCVNDRTTKRMAIGVAVSDKPTGPFTDVLGKPLVAAHWGDIDPTVFIDDDGQAYLYWGNPDLWYVKLNEDMVSYDQGLGVVKVPLTKEGFHYRVKGADKRPSSYEEGPWLYKRQSLYYLLYPAGGVPEHLAYSTSLSPTGPWMYRDTIMHEIGEGGAFTNHPGLVDYKGRTWLFYHNGALPGGGGFTRSVCADELEFTADGGIPLKKPSAGIAKGVGTINPFARVEAETIAWEKGVEAKTDSSAGIYVTDIDNGDYIKVRDVDFQENARSFEASVASGAAGGRIEIRLDSLAGMLVGDCKVEYTNGWVKWKTVTAKIKSVHGIHDLYFVFKGGEGDLFNFDWWRFTSNAQSYHKTAQGVKAEVNGNEVEIQFYSPSIVRVIKSPIGRSSVKESLSVIKTPEKIPFRLTAAGNRINLKSEKLSITLDQATGEIAFGSLLKEKAGTTGFTPFNDAGNNTFSVAQSFVLDREEAIYGLGQHQRGNMSQRNQQYHLVQGNTDDAIPFFQSVKGYGVFWDNYSPTTFSDSPGETRFKSDVGDIIDYYFMNGGNADGVIAAMRDLTGQAPLFPLWTFGYWQSKERYKGQDELVGVVRKYRELGVPLDGIIQDWQYWGNNYLWNAMDFQNPEFYNPPKMVKDVHDLNAHMIISIWSSFGPQTKPYRELKEKNMLLEFLTWPESGSEKWPPNREYPSGVRVYDAYNPAARDIYWKYANQGLFSQGIDGWWMDSSEPDHLDFKPSDFDNKTYLGSFRKVRNAYPLMTVGGVSEHQRRVTSDKRVFILTRSAFAGQQRYGANTWSGDITASWETLKHQVPTGLNFSLSGVPYWNSDMGGFFLNKFRKKLADPEYRELYARWVEFGAFCPMMRSHGADAPREIYQFGKKGDEVYDVIEKSINLRYRLLPYIYSTSWQVTAGQSSMMRALVMDFATDKKCWDMNNEYMFGKSILVRPVTDPMYLKKVVDGRDTGWAEDFSVNKATSVYLPQAAGWVDFWTGERVAGGATINKLTPLDIIPLYVKAGSILPIGPKVQYAAEKKWDNLEIRVYPGADGEFVLYEDETDNYNYEKGIYSTITFRWNNAKKTLTITDRKGSFPGMLDNRTFRIVLVRANRGIGAGTTENPDKEVDYKGKQVAIRL